MTPPTGHPPPRRTLWIVLGACAALVGCACLVATTAGAVYTFRSRPPATESPRTACDHRYLPIRQGASWTYSTSGGEITWRVVSMAGNLASALATVSAELESGPIRSTWTCDSGGVRYGLFAGFLSLEGVEDYGVSDERGYSLVPAEELVAGATWSNAYTFRAAGVSTIVSETFSAGSPTDMDTVLGPFIVIPVETARSTRREGDAGPTSPTSSLVMYFAQEVGIVRVETRTGAGLEVAELTAISIPPPQ